jgi:glycosyltransferase involved in cell wall biosynthesis
MRVLWLAPEQLPAVTGTAMTGGGWLESLRSALELYAPEIELGIASHGYIPHEPFSAGNATYFQIAQPDPTTRLRGVARSWMHDVAPVVSVESTRAIAGAFAPDVVHVHGAEHYLGLGVLDGDVPVIVSLQGFATICQRYMLVGFAWQEALRELLTKEVLRGAGIFHESWSMRRRAACENRILRECDDFMGRTDWDRALLEAVHPGARYYHVEEALDEVFYAAQWSLEGASTTTILSTTGSLPSKGTELLLDAVSILRRSYDVDIRLRLLGATPERGSMWRPLARRLSRPELRGRVDLLGRQGPRRVAEELCRASVFVQPSHIENSSNSLCEAMLVGVPCVAAHVGGLPSLVQSGVTGILYHDRDEFALAGHIAALLGDENMRVRLGKTARQVALRRHDRKAIAETTARVYRDVAAAGPRTPRATCAFGVAQQTPSLSDV